MRRICSDEDLRFFFGDGKPHSIEEIEKHFKICRVVAYREMNRIEALTAINKTGYYVLPGIRRFDRNGFFTVDDKVFFSGGTLSEALIRLVSKSHSGMKLKELQKVVCTNANVQLLNLERRNKLYRHKFAGQYYYFSADRETRTRQLEVRKRQFARPNQELILEQAETIPLELVIKILLTFIQHPDFSPKSIALSLVRRGEKVRARIVEGVFVKYDLCKKNS